MRFTVDTSEVERVAKDLLGFSDRRLQSALALAINNTARAIKDEWGGQLYTKVDRPTPLTRGAARLSERADVGHLQAEVKLRDVTDRGDPPSSYLLPQERGGSRELKKFERALVARGVMPAGTRAVPGKYATLDQFGNVSRGQIVQILNQLVGSGALSVGYRKVISTSATKRASSARRAGRTYVAVTVRKGQLKPGIYEKKGNFMLPVFWFTSRVRYRSRLSLMDHGKRIAERDLQANVNAAIEARLKSLVRRA